MSEDSYSDYAESISSTETTTNYASALSSKADYTPQTSFESSTTPFPSLTVSQRIRLNEILHKEPIGYASSFDNIELIEPVKEEPVKEEPVKEEPQQHVEQIEIEQTENNSCCCIV